LTKWGQPDRKLTMAGGGSDEIIRGKRWRRDSERKKAVDWKDRVFGCKHFPRPSPRSCSLPIAHYRDKTQITAHKSDAQEQLLRSLRRRADRLDKGMVVRLTMGPFPTLSRDEHSLPHEGCMEIVPQYWQGGQCDKNLQDLTSFNVICIEIINHHSGRIALP
jgi:hypothetical protein